MGEEKPALLEKPKRERCANGHYIYGESECSRCEDSARNERAVSASERFTVDCETRTANAKAADEANLAFYDRNEKAAAERHEDWKKIVGEQTEAIKAQTAAFERIANALEKRGA